MSSLVIIVLSIQHDNLKKRSKTRPFKNKTKQKKKQRDVLIELLTWSDHNTSW